MARKLGLSWGMICAAALLTAGCQSTGGARMASNTTPRSPAVTRQITTPPQPNFPNSGPPNNSGFSSANGYPQSPNLGKFGDNPTFATNPNVTPISNQTNNPPVGPQGSLGAPTTTSNRNVTFTQPMIPMPPPTPAAPPSLPVAPAPALTLPELPPLPTPPN